LRNREEAAVDGGISSRRAAENQSAYRAVNEQIKDLNRTFDELGTFGSEWLCECADTECTLRILATMEEYEAVRANPRTFLVYPGHEIAEVERVVGGNGHYTIVEKLDNGGAIAEQLDPRHTDEETTMS
jgi:antibiotic biosynthesis monooxygenase (ABM) superfamily enzyme